MGYQRETLMLRAPGGGRMGFLVWERGTKQGMLRCQAAGLLPRKSYRLLWMREGAFELRDGGRVHSDEGGGACQTLVIDGDVPLVGAVLAQDDGTLCAQAFIQSAVQAAPERLQALLAAQQQNKTGHRVRPSGYVQGATTVAQDTACEPMGTLPQAIAQGRADGRWRAPAWPPPPGMPGARWHNGYWATATHHRTHAINE